MMFVNCEGDSSGLICIHSLAMMQLIGTITQWQKVLFHAFDNNTSPTANTTLASKALGKPDVDTANLLCLPVSFLFLDTLFNTLFLGLFKF